MSSPRDFFPVSVRCIKILIQVGEWLCLLTVEGRICLLELFAGLGYTENDFWKLQIYKKYRSCAWANFQPTQMKVETTKQDLKKN